ncbi:MAG: hypothetical protein IKG67_04885 [Parasporobacterium sp.]|nr:hypothetical protein [Parasporobacterium sp.]
MKTKETVLQHSEDQAVVKGEQRMDNNMEIVSEIQLISTKTLQKMLGCCYNTAVRIGSDAGARIQIGSMVRWRVSKISEYLDSKQEEK